MAGTGGSGFVVVDGHANNLRPGHGEGGHLLDGRGDVRGIGVGHRLHDNRDFPAYANIADLDGGCLPTLNLRHSNLFLFSLPARGFLLGNSGGARTSHVNRSMKAGLERSGIQRI